MCCNLERAKPFLGNMLIVFIFVFWTLQNHVFILIAYCVGSGLGAELNSMDIGNWAAPNFYDKHTPSLLCFGIPGSDITPIAVVYFVNSVGQFHSEIQSWEIAYISWAWCSALIWTVVVLQHQEIFNKIDFKKWLFFPFGMAIDSTYIDLWWWASPLIATAPASVIGFIANFILDEKFDLICKPQYNSISTICYDDVCCITRSSRDGTGAIFFMASLASTILASWGVIKIVVMLAAEGDTWIQNEEQANKEKMRALIADFLKEYGIASIDYKPPIAGQ